MAAPDQIKITHQRPMTTSPTICAALDALAARPLLEQVAALADCIGANTVGQITAISNRAAAWLRANPPGQPRAIEPRGCPTPGACSCVEPASPAPEQGDAWWHELINEIARVQHVAQGEGQGPRFDLAKAVELSRRPTPPAPEPGEAKELHPLWYLVEFLEGHSSFRRRTEPTDELAEILSNSATLLQQQAAELAALREERFVAGQNRINQLWVDALDPSTQVPLSAPQIKKLRKVLDDHCDQGPPNGTMWKSQELEELMWAVEGWVSAATPPPAPQAGEGEA